MKTNRAVAEAWKNGKSASARNMWTDGQTIRSYKMVIGLTASDGRKVGLNVRGRFGYSQTTSCHVGLVARHADQMVNPVVTYGRGWTGSWRVFPANWEEVTKPVFVPVSTEEAEAPELTFVCLVQNEETLEYIQELLNDPDITAASFRTDTGTYAPLYVRYGRPSYRSGGQWFKYEGSAI